MTSTSALISEHQSRYWLLVHSGKTHPLTWADGERLLSLAASVRAGLSEPQSFSFVPRGQAAVRTAVTITVREDEPLELLTEYESTGVAYASHWFG